MKSTILSRNNDVRMAQLLARELGLRADSDVIDRLASQFAAFRSEREQQLTDLKAEFDRELAGLRAELARTKAQLKILQTQ